MCGVCLGHLGHERKTSPAVRFEPRTAEVKAVSYRLLESKLAYLCFVPHPLIEFCYICKNE